MAGRFTSGHYYTVADLIAVLQYLPPDHPLYSIEVEIKTNATPFGGGPSEGKIRVEIAAIPMSGMGKFAPDAPALEPGTPAIPPPRQFTLPPSDPFYLPPGPMPEKE